MSQLVPALPPFWISLAEPRDTVRTTSPELPVHDPVFIHDAVTPYRGETVLSHFLRRDLQKLLEDGHDV